MPNSFTQEVSPEFTVRLIYFRPNDREPIPNIDTKFDATMKDIQQYFADMMEYHGFGRKTFRLETDATGKAIVHHIIGENDTAYYENHRLAELDETRKRFDIDTSKNIYLLATAIDPYSQYDDNHESNKIVRGGGWGESLSGYAIFPAGAITGDTFDSRGLIVHELGHAFGLRHDYDVSRPDAVYFPGTDSIPTFRRTKMTASFCAAEWLDAHRYFNTDQTDPNIFNENTTVEMLPPSLAAPPDVIRFRFEIADPDGLHRVQFISTVTSIISCKKLNGKSATVELVTTKLIDSTVVLLQVMDIHGNFGGFRFPIDMTTLPLPPPEVISMPDPNLAAAVRETLGLAADADITQLDMVRLRRFDAVDRQITDLTGLEHALRINILDLSRNQISDITPITKMTDLIHLRIDNNSINDITPLTGLTNLTYLVLGNNDISDITPLTGMTKLVQLSLGFNQISDIRSLAGLTNLVILELYNNDISDVTPLTGLVNLENLLLLRNPIKNKKPLLNLLKKNPNIKIYLKRGGGTLPVTLSQFRAEHTGAGVILNWTTESEIDNAGFYIYRSLTKEGEFKVVNPTMIQGADTTGERNTYRWTDTTAKPNTIYYYRIEDVSHAGVREQLATVRLKGFVSAKGK